MKTYKEALISLVAVVVPLFGSGCAVEAASGEQSVADASNAVTVFSEAISDTVSFEISRHADGNLSMLVSGAIGEDDYNNFGAAIRPSFTETYLNLRKDLKEAPPELQALEAERPPVASPVDRTQPKDIHAFLDTVCKGMVVGLSWYVPKECMFNFFDPHSITLQKVMCPAAGDISFVWNESPFSGGHSLVGIAGTTAHVPPHRWGWFAWSSNLPCAKATLSVPNAGLNKLGITRHAR